MLGERPRYQERRRKSPLALLIYAFTITDVVGGKKRVGLVAPAAYWVAAAASPHDQLNPNVGSFTYVTLPIEQGRARTAAFEFAEEALTEFRGVENAHDAALPMRVPTNTPVTRVVIDVESGGLSASVARLGESSALDDCIENAIFSGGTGRAECRPVGD